VPLLKPSRLRPGETIGLICPASAPVSADRIAAGVRYLEARGYRVRVGRHAGERHGAFAGTDAARLEDLNGFLRDPDVRMILAVRGGYGTPRLLAEVDYDAVRRDPKLVVGYSDLTALQMALFAQTGLVTVSGPMAGVEFRTGPDPFTEAHFWGLVTGDPAAEVLGNPPGALPQVLRSGTAEGPLLGGCLSLVTALMGTPYLPSLAGSLLVLEDIHEQWHRVDRMLTQLKLSGQLPAVAGLVLGQFTDCSAAEPRLPALGLPEIFRELTTGAAYPVLTDFAYGHEARKVSVPWGVPARLDTTEGGLRLLESPVA
jgi:muramoyltetrapeptide carboxypeptidase